MMKRLVVTFLLAAGVQAVQAEEAKFLQLSLTPDIALQSKDTRINGISLQIWGQNPQSSLQLGFVNGSTGESKGLALGLVNYAESYTGVQWGVVNISKNVFKGWQNGFVNIGKEVHGLQWGAVNYTESLTGVQLGLVNIVKDNPWFEKLPEKFAKGFVFVNWSF